MSRLHYLFLGLFLFAMIHLPGRWTDFFRSQAAAALSPAWRSVLPFAALPLAQRKLDMLALQEQVDALQEWLMEETRLKELSAQLNKNPQRQSADFKRRVERQKRILALRFAAMPAQVIFRDPSSWSSILWIGLGSADNRAIGRIVIERNSPVLLGNSLVGVVEYVGESQSRVRLISDSGLAVAVRALRGESQNREISAHVEQLLQRIQVRHDLFASSQEQESLMDLLALFQARLQSTRSEMLLAKGELCGCSAPLWRSRGPRLKGTGFNYDYPDEEGPARDLRTGRPFGAHADAAEALLREGDLLVTSGLDGVFPPGIEVAVVKTVEPLLEGSCTYNLEAIPTAGNLHELRNLFVLPPVGGAEDL